MLVGLDADLRKRESERRRWGVEVEAEVRSSYLVEHVLGALDDV